MVKKCINIIKNRSFNLEKDMKSALGNWHQKGGYKL